MTAKPPPKRDVMLALLQHTDSVFVNFDPRRDGVVVPAHLKRQPRVVLQYGLNMRIPIPDLDVGEDGIGATLSFEGRPTWTFVPWAAVFAIISQDQKGMLWESDLPREIEAEHKKQTAPGEAKKSAQPPAGKGNSKRPPAGKRPALRAVDGGADKPVEAVADERVESQPPTPLRLERSPSEPAAAEPTAAEPAAAEPAPASERPAAVTAATSERPEVEPAPASERPSPERPDDEIVEPPQREPKKKREIPPYLRVVK